MNSLQQFLVGGALLFALCLLATVVYAIWSLTQANSNFKELAENAVLASRSSNPEELAKAIAQRDQARADVELQRKELQKLVPSKSASLVPDNRPVVQSDPDVLEIAGLPLRRINR